MVNISNIASRVGQFVTSRGGMYMGIILVFVAMALVMTWKFQAYKSGQYNANHETTAIKSGAGSDTKPATIMLFSASWCPVCVKFAPVWTQMKEKYDGQIINGHDVIFVTYDCSKRDDPEAMAIQEEYGITGYPTIKIKRDGEIIDFEGERTEETMTEFLFSVL